MTLNCNKINSKEIIALANSDNTPDEVLDIYKKYNDWWSASDL